MSPPSKLKIRPGRMVYVLWRLGVRFLIVLTVLVLIGLLYLSRWLQEDPDYFVQRGLALIEARFTVEEALWAEDGWLHLRNVRFGPKDDLWLIVGRVDVNINWVDLILEGRVEQLDLRYPQLWMARYERALEAAGDDLPNLSFGQTRIYSGTVMLDEIAPDVQPIPVQLGQGKPVVINDFQLTNWKESPALNNRQTAVVNNLLITSPYDALSPVMSFEKIAVTFTWGGLLDRKIERLYAERPIIYLGPDLFWFSDELQKSADSSVAMDSWLIKDFVAHEGRLGVNVFGAGGIVFPPPFFCEAKNLDLGDTERSRINTLFKFKKDSYKYPEYGLEVLGLRGRIEFALPLDAKKADNVVPTLFADAISWQGIAVTEPWTSITFDQQGIYGRLGGKFYEGDVSSNFQILFDGGFPWEGDFFVLKTNMEPIIQDLISRYLQLKGYANGKFHVKGGSTKLEQADAEFQLLERGVFNVKFIADLQDRIPEDWLPLYKQLAEILIKSFKTYDFTGGNVTASYVPGVSKGHLKLNGLQGKRSIRVVVTEEDVVEAEKETASERARSEAEKEEIAKNEIPE